MPGILCSAYDPSDTRVEPRGRHGLELIEHQLEHVQENHSEPGFQLACVYHPEVCQRHYQALLNGLLSPADQVCGLLPPALFIHKLKRQLAIEPDSQARVI